MSLAFIISLLLSGAALLTALRVIFTRREWGFVLLPLVLVLLVSIQVFQNPPLSWNLTAFIRGDELAGLASILLLTLAIAILTKGSGTHRNNDTQYRMLFENANDSIVIFDPDTTEVLEVNKKACDTYGFAREEFPGMILKRLSKDYKRCEEQIREVLREGSIKNFETTHFRKDGTSVDFLINSSVVDYNGRKAILSINHEITDRKQALYALQESEEKYRTLIERMNEGILYVDNDDVILFANNRFCEMLGYTAEELIGKVGYKLLVHPEDWDLLLNKNLLRTHDVSDRYEIRMRKKSGETVWLEISGAAMKNAQGEFIGSVGIHTDISDRKGAVEEIRNLARFPDENPSPILRIAADGTILYANRASDAMLLYWQRKVGETAPAEWGAYVRECHDSGRSTEVETACGDRITLVMLAPVSETGYVNMYARDITERKHAEQALHYRVEFEKLITALSTNFINLSADEIDEAVDSALERIGKFVEVDRAYLFMLSSSGATVSNTHEWCAGGIAPQIGNLQNISIDGFAAWMERLERFESIHIPSVANLAPDAQSERELLEAQGIKSLLFVPLAYRKSLVGFLGFDSVLAEKDWNQDIISLLKIVGEMFVGAVERNRTNERLQFQVNILKNVRDLVVVTDLNGRITYWNDGATAIFGYDAEEMLGREATVLYPEYSENALGTRLQEIAGGPDDAGDWSVRRKDGTFIWLDIKTTAMRNQSGNVIGFLSVAEDITERKQSEEVRKSLEAQVRQAQKLDSLGTLAGGIAHDFNNILGIILGHAALVTELPATSSMRDQSVVAISKAVNRGAQLVRQILTFARKSETRLEPINVNQTIEELVRMLERTFPKTITFSLDLAEPIPQFVGDGSQLHQALLNLCVNARDAMLDSSANRFADAELTIRTQLANGKQVRRRFHNAKDQTHICVSVTDTGVGMDEATKQRIFEPFFTTKELGRGTGLGLAVVYGVVRSLEGHIDVESTLGQGTTFSLYVPVSETESKGVETPIDCSMESAGGTETILLVEDEESLLTLMKVVLESNGYRVLTARDGIEAVQLFTEHKDSISLVLTDIGLPKLDGAGVYSTLKKINPTVKIILASGFIDPRVRTELRRAGATTFVQKPYVPAEVLHKIRTTIDSEPEKRFAG